MKIQYSTGIDNQRRWCDAIILGSYVIWMGESFNKHLSFVMHTKWKFLGLCSFAFQPLTLLPSPPPPSTSPRTESSGPPHRHHDNRASE